MGVCVSMGWRAPVLGVFEARYAHAMDVGFLVLGLVTLAAYLVLPWWALRRAVVVHRASPTSRARAALKVGLVGAMVAIAAPLVGVGIVIRTFEDIAGADSASRATALARGLSEAMNCGALLALVAVGTSGLTAALAWTVTRNRTRGGDPDAPTSEAGSS